MVTSLLFLMLTFGEGAPSTAAAPAASSPAAAETSKSGPSLATVIANVQKRYDQVKDFRAQFTQNYVRTVMGRTTVSVGKVAFKKPGRMRWDYEQPEPRMFLSTGQYLWLYEPEEKQAFRQDLKSSQLPAALAFLMGKGKITDEFDVSFATDTHYGQSGDFRLALRPKQPQSTYKSILFVVDPKDFSVRETVLVDQQGNVNHFVFKNLELNVKVPDDLFRWSPPPGVRVVDTGNVGK